MTDNHAPGAMTFALKLLGLRSHSKDELKRKLLKKGYSSEGIEPVIEKLSRMGALDDHAFGMEVIRSRSRRKPSGRLKIIAELRKKGVAETIISELLKEYDSVALCHRAAEKKLGSLREMSEADRKRKLEVFLSNRGFEWQEIQSALRLLVLPCADDDEPC